MLTQEELQRIFDYDNGFLRWKIAPPQKPNFIGTIAGHKSSDGRTGIKIDQVRYRAHRLIYMYHFGYCPPILDHINGNNSDNRIENLRPATVMENGCNSKTPCSNTSGIKGVSWDKINKKWFVHITYNKKQYNLGRYKTVNEAREVIERARNLFHKGFANHG